MTESWHGKACWITGPLWGKSIDDQRDVCHKEPEIRSFCVFFGVSLHKESNCRWFESPCRLCDVILMSVLLRRWPLCPILPDTGPDRGWGHLAEYLYWYSGGMCGESEILGILRQQNWILLCDHLETKWKWYNTRGEKSDWCGWSWGQSKTQVGLNENEMELK